MNKLSETLKNCREKEDEWALANNGADYTVSFNRKGDMYVTTPEYTDDIVDSSITSVSSNIIASSVDLINTPNTTGQLNLGQQINLGHLTINPNNISQGNITTTTPYITQYSYNYRVPTSVYSEDKVTKELLDSYANDSFIFDKDSKIMIYKDKNGDYFIQEPLKHIEADDIEKELKSKKEASVLQSTVDEYFGK